ncbi:MAG: hypothetical protein JW384_02040 [Nitrosomonadaceae bacterium]|nr:hypothetical protein [Nitrosomonadaceae bacterium]
MYYLPLRIWKQRRSTLFAIFKRKAIIQQRDMGYATFTKRRFDLCHGIISLVFLTD